MRLNMCVTNTADPVHDYLKEKYILTRIQMLKIIYEFILKVFKYQKRLRYSFCLNFKRTQIKTHRLA